ncbi:2429_t:CDS:2 [Cetraspora pellucida]|uniref:2429_t:CDS:1 n=1 Tax=Cetraspora pellucida TaxID=1433469 RepID=A0ACA9M5A2_9GLOM|nr:2429_t:CDS:2 [Cetraspora pellucida]
MTKKTIKKKVCQSYTIQEKMIVIRYALHESNTKATAKFDLDKSQVGCWIMKLKDQLSKVGYKKSCHLGSSDRKKFFPEEEAQLYAWIVEMHNAALAITYNSLKLKMLRIVSETALKSHELAKRQLASSFKTFSIWLMHFLKCHKLTLCQKTKIAQKMPADLEEKLLNFQQHVIQLHYMKNYSLSNIANMNETSVWFDMAGNLTIKEINTKTVHIYTTGNENNCFTSSPSSDVIVFFHKKGWMDEQRHLTDAVKTKVKENNNDFVVISKISPKIIQCAFRKCSISNAIDGSEDDEIYHYEIFDNRTHQTSDKIRCDEIYSNEICLDEVPSENIIIIDSSKDEDNNTNQDIFVEDNEEVFIFATNQ